MAHKRSAAAQGPHTHIENLQNSFFQFEKYKNRTLYTNNTFQKSHRIRRVVGVITTTTDNLTMLTRAETRTHLLNKKLRLEPSPAPSSANRRYNCTRRNITEAVRLFRTAQQIARSKSRPGGIFSRAAKVSALACSFLS